MEKKWLSLITASIENGLKKISNYSLEFPNGVTHEDIENAETKLGFTLPEDLKSLLGEFDGVHEHTVTDKGEKIQVGSILWSLESIIKWHISCTIPAKARLFCFGGSITGNSFGYLIVDGKPDESQIWQGDHETCYPDEQIVWRASNLQDFISTSFIESRWY